MLSIKGEAAKYAYHLIKQRPGLSKNEVTSILLSNQLLLCIPIAPFNILKDGTLCSEVINNAIDDLVHIGVLSLNNEALKVTRLKNPYENYKVDFPTFAEFDLAEAIDSLRQRKEKKIGSKTFTTISQCSLTTRQLSIVTPINAEIGVLFSLPPEHTVFESAIPLLSAEQPLKTSVLLAPSEKIDLTTSSIGKNLKKMNSFAYQVLGKTFEERRFQNALKVIMLLLMPLSSISLQYECTLGHVFSKNYDNYMKALFPIPLRCEKCPSRIKRADFIIRNQKIFTDWHNGALNEFFVTSTISKANGKSKANLWNFNIGTEQFDGLIYDDSKIVAVECKRILDYGTNYSNGIEQLKTHKKTLKECGLPIKTLLFTLLREKVAIDPSIDVILTANDYNSFISKSTVFL